MHTQTEHKPYHEMDFRTPDDVSLFVESQVREKNRWRLSYEQQWLKNIAMYIGDQYVVWDRTRGDLVTPPRPAHRVRMVNNLIMPYVRNAIARVIKKDPVVSVEPATSDDEDVRVSKVSSHVVKYYQRYLNMSQIRIECLVWLMTTGLGFLRVGWNPNKGAEMVVTPYDIMQRVSMYGEDATQLYEDADGEFQEMTGVDSGSYSVYSGEIEVEALSPFEVLWDASVNFKDSPWVMVSKTRNMDFVNENWPDRIEEISGKSATRDETNTRYFENRLVNMHSSSSLSNSEKVDTSEMVVVHELFVKPCKKYKNGHYAVVIDGVVLESGDNPYRGIPISACSEVVVPGRPIPGSVIEQLIPLQHDYNKTLSQMQENRNKMSNPKVLVPSGSVGKFAFTDAPGEVVEYNPVNGARPEYLAPTGLPSYVLEHMQQVRADFEDISGQHEVTNAKAPGGVTAGYALEILAEQDDTRLGPVIKSYERCESEAMRNLLKILRMFVVEERMITLTGREYQYDMDIYFSGNGLVGPNESNPNVNYYDVQIDITSGMTDSQAARKETVFELINRGWLDPKNEHDRMVVFGALNMDGKQSRWLEEQERDEAKAMMETRKMQRGEFVPVMRYENHFVEWFQHNRFRKSEEFKTLPPQLQQMFNRHCDEHESWMKGIDPNAPPPPPQPMQQGVQPAQPIAQGGAVGQMQNAQVAGGQMPAPAGMT